jgi:c-di-GMP-binding flagellar brake protein YcgR
MNVTEPRTVERRRHGRVRLRLPGQFMREDRQEFPCVTIDISPGGMALAADAQVAVGEKVIAYLSQIGRVQGTVARLFYGGFAISMKLPPLKRDKLSDQLTWLANRQDLGMPEDRRHERITARNPHTSLTLTGGKEYMAKIIDVSQSGVALSVSASPQVGTPVTVGATKGQVVRLFATGVAVEFTRLIPEDKFDETVVL